MLDGLIPPYILRVLPELAWALGVTAQVALGALAAAAGWAVLLLLGLQSGIRAAALACRLLIDIARYTPVLLQLYLVYFGLPLIGITLSAFMCGVIAIGFQEGAYFAEILRGGIKAVDPRQIACGHALGLRSRQVFLRIVLPQAILKALPPLGSQSILLFKDTTIVAAIGIMETTLTAKRLAEQSGATYQLFALVALMFILSTSVLGLGVRLLERVRVNRFGT